MFTLFDAYKAAAKVVALYGDAYLPVFERLHEEVKKSRDQEVLKSLAIQIADKYNDER